MSCCFTYVRVFFIFFLKSSSATGAAVAKDVTVGLGLKVIHPHVSHSPVGLLGKRETVCYEQI